MKTIKRLYENGIKWFIKQTFIRCIINKQHICQCEHHNILRKHQCFYGKQVCWD